MDRKIRLENLKDFCQKALEAKGTRSDLAEITARVLSETDAYGTYSHGTKNLYGYVKKAEAGGLILNAEPKVLKEGPSFALMDAENGLGMVASFRAMELACEKALDTGLALVTVKNSTHFGAAGFYSNQAAQKGLFGIAMSNVDPNMTVPGARGMILGNNPFSYASPADTEKSVFLDIAMSNVASLKVIQAKKEGKSIPDTWIVDKDGLPTTDPSRYPEEGAMQPFASHKGYGLALMVELLTGVLSGGGISSTGDIGSWCFAPGQYNNVSHTFIVIDIDKFAGRDNYISRSRELFRTLQNAPKARGKERIYVPGEIEWENHKAAEKELLLPDAVVEQLELLSGAAGVKILWD